MITSKDNPKIKQIRLLQADSKARREEGAFVVEGVRLVEESFSSGWPAQWVIYTEDLDARGRTVIDGFSKQGILVDLVSPQVMRSVSDTQTPQGLLAVLAAQSLPLPSNLDFVFIPDGVRDPGNLGTMLRTAWAAGVQAVLQPPGTVDPFSPKVLRSAMGAHFHLPLLPLNWEEIRDMISKGGLNVYLAETESAQIYTRLDWQKPLVLIVGGEAEGAGPQAQVLATQRVCIPMPGGSESLNAANAAAILLFEAVRQRKLI